MKLDSMNNSASPFFHFHQSFEASSTSSFPALSTERFSRDSFFFFFSRKQATINFDAISVEERCTFSLVTRELQKENIYGSSYGSAFNGSSYGTSCSAKPGTLFDCKGSWINSSEVCVCWGITDFESAEKVMASKMDNFQISLLKQFVDLCKQKPDLLHSPQLKFFKDWLEK